MESANGLFWFLIHHLNKEVPANARTLLFDFRTVFQKSVSYVIAIILLFGRIFVQFIEKTN